MSSELSIDIRNLGKAYTIDHAGDNDTLAEAIMARLRHPFASSNREEFWALRHLNLEVRRGEVLGVIGQNGAGKSTLLKLLSRITEPTEGEAFIHGRTGSLLEVGTGFHRELTGRENIYLNGGILGMTRREIDKHFDEIVEFAGVERFLDTPVKRYSSGMFVRLAFAVAAHLDSEVLIVDEVLAVGDASFQRKCLGKMDETAKSGRTVLFVSHNMAMVQALCPRCVLMVDGDIAFDGDTGEAVDRYLDELSATGSTGTHEDDRPGTGEARITSVRLIDGRGEQTPTIVAGDDAALEVEYKNPGRLRHPKMLANIYNSQGAPVCSLTSDLTGADLGAMGEAGRLVCHLPRVALMPGRYRLALALHADGRSADYLPAALVFEVNSSLFYCTGRLPENDRVVFLPEHSWQHETFDHESELAMSSSASGPIEPSETP